MAQEPPNSTVDALRRLVYRLRCSVCGSYETRLIQRIYRLDGDGGQALTLAALVCMECKQVRLFSLEVPKE